VTAHILDVVDLGASGVAEIVELAQRTPESLARPLGGRGVALIFEKPSNRTRHSMEIAVVELGGHPVYTRGEEIGFDVREPVEDVGRILSGYHAMVAARVFSHATVERLAASCSVPVVNMLSDFAGPEGFGPDPTEVERIVSLGAASFETAHDPREAVAGADAVHTDTWVSMGQEAEKAERLRTFADYTVNPDLMAAAGPSAIFMHCLPAYRGLEVSAEVIDGPASRVVRQGHNRLHSARGALAWSMGVR